MTAPILSTKLFIPPPRAGWVQRPHLLERLNEGLHAGRRLILLSAPAGFGKTTLLSEWIGSQAKAVDLQPQERARFCWLSLDEGDNDPAHFMRYLVSAVQTVSADLGKAAAGFFQLTLPQPEVPYDKVLTSLLNDLARYPQTVCLVLDDYHRIAAPVIHGCVSFLLENLPPNARIILASRSLPPVPFARLRARDQMVEIGAQELRFTPEEAREFLNQVMRLDLPPEDAAVLEERTEGWPVGLQLAGLALQGSLSNRSLGGRRDLAKLLPALAGANRFLIDYLAEEVLSRQTPEVQRFLLQTSALSRFNADLCRAVFAGLLVSDPALLLKDLERSNLFLVPLDAAGNWYRYHTLFADFLRGSLDAKLKAGTLSKYLAPFEVHRRASAWFEQAGMLSEAIDAALKAGEKERAAGLVERISRNNLLVPGEGRALLDWLDALGADMLESHPQLALHRAWALLITGQIGAAEQEISAFTQNFGGNAPPEVQGEAAAIQTLMHALHNEIPQAIEQAQRALALLPADADLLRGLVSMNLGLAYDMAGEAGPAIEAYRHAVAIAERVGLAPIAMMSTSQLGDLYLQQGKLSAAADIYTQALATVERSPAPLPVAGMVYTGMAQVLYEWNRLDEAEALLEKANEVSSLWESADQRVVCAMFSARISLARGDGPEVEEALRQAAEFMQRDMASPQTVRVAQAQRAWILTGMGQPTRAAEWAQNLTAPGIGTTQEPAEAPPLFLQMLEGTALSRYFLLTGEAQPAVEILQNLLQAARRAGLVRAQIEILLLSALAQHALGRAQLALEALCRALELAEKEQYLRVFLDEIPAGLPLLKAAAQQNDFARRLVTLLNARPAQPGLVEPLSERELDVLRLIAAGLTNQEIAERLVVALSTIKTHINNIYGKLGVQTRVQALKRATELHYLP